MSEQPRVPLPANTSLIGANRTIQVNHCCMPDCDNFGGPARPEHGKPGPSANRDPHYKVESTKWGTVPSVRCKACRDNPLIKSNAAIVAEIERLADADGLLWPEETAGCRNEGCGSKLLLSSRTRLSDDHQRMAADIFSRIANKAPVQRSIPLAVFVVVMSEKCQSAIRCGFSFPLMVAPFTSGSRWHRRCDAGSPPLGSLAVST